MSGIGPGRGARAGLVVIVLAAGLTAGLRGARAAVPPRIMPLGDSTTAGLANVPTDGAYRTNLETRLLSDGRGFDFVGSGSKGPSELLDKHHEGHGGYRVNDVSAGIGGWFNQSTPDIVLLMIGTNDIRSGPIGDLPTLPARLGALLDKMAQLRPATHVVVASIPPQPDLAPPKFDAARQQAFADYNNAIPGLVSQRAQQGKLVSFADVNAALLPGDVPDGSHPSPAGYTKVAGVFRNALVPLVPVSQAGVDYVSSLEPLEATNGYGPYERNQSNGGPASGDGTPLKMKGVVYGRGLGVVPPSSIRYGLGGGYARFMATVGLDDVVSPNGSVVFQVLTDGDLVLFNSGLMTSASTPKAIDVSVAGRSSLRLVVGNGGDGSNWDHADWGLARLVRSGSPPPPTTSTTTTTSAPTTTAPTTTTTAPPPATTTTTTPPPSGSTVFVSNLTPTSATNGLGPYERDQSNGGAAAGDGRPLRLKGVLYPKGLGVVPASTLVYNLGGAYSRFLATVGIDDVAQPNGSVVFQVFTEASATPLYTSGVVTWSSGPNVIDVSVAGRSTLRLVVTDAGDGTAWDHADWANARLVVS